MAPVNAIAVSFVWRSRSRATVSRSTQQWLEDDGHDTALTAAPRLRASLGSYHASCPVLSHRPHSLSCLGLSKALSLTIDREGWPRCLVSLLNTHSAFHQHAAGLASSVATHPRCSAIPQCFLAARGHSMPVPYQNHAFLIASRTCHTRRASIPRRDTNAFRDTSSRHLNPSTLTTQTSSSSPCHPRHLSLLPPPSEPNRLPLQLSYSAPHCPTYVSFPPACRTGWTRSAR